VVADWRERASVLRTTGYANDARLIERMCGDVTTAAEEYFAWLSESEAMLYEGRRTRDPLRNRFAELEARGLARREGRYRYYRRIALRHRGNAEAAREAGRRAVRRVA
jgi:hypothetical protein